MKNQIIALVVGMILLLFSFGFAQAPDTLWTRTYGGDSLDYATSIVQTTSGEYMAVGYTKSFGAGGVDIWLIKLDSQGDTVWTKTYGGPFDDYAAEIQQTVDGGYILVGGTQLFSAESIYAYLIKTDENGDTIWAKTYGNSTWNAGLSVKQTPDRGFVLVGYESDDLLIIKTDSLGDMVWTKTYGDSFYDVAESVQIISGGYIIAGWTNAYDVYLLKTNTMGDTVWTKKYNNYDTDFAYSVCVTSSEGYEMYITVGETWYEGWFEDIIITKTDYYGGTNYVQHIGNYYSSEVAKSIIEAADSTYMVTGWKDSLGVGGLYLAKIRQNGNILWDTTYDPYGSTGECIQRTTDGGYIISGHTGVFGSVMPDAYFLKTAADVGIYEDENWKAQIGEWELTPSPNPFCISTTISLCEVSDNQNTKISDLSIYDASGRKVRILITYPIPHAPCPMHVKWDGRDEAGKLLPPGIYFVKLNGKPAGKVVKVR
jgi:hypothetical protein